MHTDAAIDGHRRAAVHHGADALRNGRRDGEKRDYEHGHELDKAPHSDRVWFAGCWKSVTQVTGGAFGQIWSVKKGAVLCGSVYGSESEVSLFAFSKIFDYVILLPQELHIFFTFAGGPVMCISQLPVTLKAKQ